MPMKELQIFRIFALFPLIGILTPDLADGFHISFSSIPAEHIIVDVTLLICIAICSAGIMAAENSGTASETAALA